MRMCDALKTVSHSHDDMCLSAMRKTGMPAPPIENPPDFNVLEEYVD